MFVKLRAVIFFTLFLVKTISEVQMPNLIVIGGLQP